MVVLATSILPALDHLLIFRLRLGYLDQIRHHHSIQLPKRLYITALVRPFIHWVRYISSSLTYLTNSSLGQIIVPSILHLRNLPILPNPYLYHTLHHLLLSQPLEHVLITQLKRQGIAPVSHPMRLDDDGAEEYR
jgi:hypothetical protein